MFRRTSRAPAGLSGGPTIRAIPAVLALLVAVLVVPAPSGAQQPTGTITFLFTDLEGFCAAVRSNATRIRNRCEITGRPRAYYRKLGMSRIALRELGNKGLVPGLVKSSW
jgi:ribosomal protein S14